MPLNRTVRLFRGAQRQKVRKLQRALQIIVRMDESSAERAGLSGNTSPYFSGGSDSTEGKAIVNLLARCDQVLAAKQTYTIV